MLKNQLKSKLYEIEQKEAHCKVSIIVPLDAGVPAIKKNNTKIKNAISDAIKKVKQFDELPSDKARSVRLGTISYLENLLESYDYHLGGGTFLAYASENFIHFMQMPFQVEGKVIVDDSFEIRDVIYALNRLLSYYVLQLSMDESILFYGLEDRLAKDSGFEPQVFKEKFEGKKVPLRVYSEYIKGGDDTKKYAEAKKQYFKHLAKKLEEHLSLDDETPVFVLGTEKNIGFFKSETKLGNQIAKWIHGNFKKMSEGELSQIVWPEVLEWLEAQKEQFLTQEIDEAVSARRFATGLTEVWTQAVNGNIRYLGVEKGYVQRAFTSKENPYEVLLEEPSDYSPEKYDHHPDFVDDIIEKTLSKKNSKVIFTKEGELVDRGKIVAVTHY